MYWCELDHKKSGMPKNWCFWTVVLEKTLESPLDTRRSNQSILKEISPKYSLEGLVLKLKLRYLATWCEERTHLKRPWCWEKLKAEGEGDDRGWDGWMASLTLWTWVWVSSGSWWWTGRPGVLQSMGLQRVTTERLNWTEPGVDKASWLLLVHMRGPQLMAEGRLREAYTDWVESCLSVTLGKCVPLEASVPQLDKDGICRVAVRIK